MRIGVISDTHIPRRRLELPPFVFESFSGVDMILHAGDINDFAVLKALNGIAPTEAVAGNTDPPGLAEYLGYMKELEIRGFKIGLTHGHFGRGRSTPERAHSNFADADIVVFGHSHRPYNKWHGKCLLLNPGSPTDRRGEACYSLGIITLGDTINAEILYFEAH